MNNLVIKKQNFKNQNYCFKKQDYIKIAKKFKMSRHEVSKICKMFIELLENKINKNS